MRLTLLHEMFRAARATTDSPADAELVGRLADGSEALDELIRRHGPWLLGLCRRLTPDPHTAEDVFQATMLVLVRRAGALRRYASVAGFLHGVAVKVAARARTQARRAAPTPQRAPLPDPADEAAVGEEARILHEELARLPGRYREPILLCDLAGLTREEAARRLGCSEGAVKWRLERGRAALRVQLMRRGVAAGIVLGMVASVPPALAATVIRAVNGSAASVAGSVAELMTAATTSVIVPNVGSLALLVVVGICFGLGFAPSGVHSAPPSAAPPLAVGPVLVAAPVPPPDNRPVEETLAKAVEVLDKLEGRALERSELWCAVSDLQRKLGKHDDARAALKRARAVAEALGKDQYHRWRQIGECYARLGDTKAVIDLAASVPAEEVSEGGYPRDTILQESAWAAAEVGNAQAAKQIADALSDGKGTEWVRSGLRHRLLVHQAKSGDIAGAIRAAEKLPTPADRVHALTGAEFLNLDFDESYYSWNEGIAAVQLAAGDRAGAKETAMKALAQLPDVAAEERGRPACSVVTLLARLDDVIAARKSLGHVPPKPKPQAAPQPGLEHWWDLKAKAFIAAAEARAGRDDAAKALALDFASPGQQAYVLQYVGLAQGRAGRKDAAKATFARAAELLEKTDGTGTGWHLLAAAQTLAGDHDGAVKSAEQPSGATPSIWSNVASLRAQAGDFTAARKIVADHLGEESYRFTIAQFIARKQAQAGQSEAVREWAAKEENDLLRAYILVGLAEGLYKEVPKARKP
jgi:RNA polymerase sigma factor (sigma-70 family)